MRTHHCSLTARRPSLAEGDRGRRGCQEDPQGAGLLLQHLQLCGESELIWNLLKLHFPAHTSWCHKLLTDDQKSLLIHSFTFCSFRYLRPTKAKNIERKIPETNNFVSHSEYHDEISCHPTPSHLGCERSLCPASPCCTYRTIRHITLLQSIVIIVLFYYWLLLLTSYSA